jgi:hypothetical protein
MCDSRAIESAWVPRTPDWGFELLRHLASRGQAPATPAASVAGLTWQSYGQILGFGLSIPVFFVWKSAWLLWIVVPLVFDRVTRRRRRTAGRLG